MKSILRNTFNVLEAREKKKFLLLIGLDIVTSILDVASLALLLWIIQFYIHPFTSHIPAFLPGWMADNHSPWLIAFFSFLFVLKNIATWFIIKACYKFNSDVAIRMSWQKLSDYLHSGYQDFVRIDSSQHIRTICYQPFEFCQYVLLGLQQIITQLCLVSVTIVVIVIFNAKLFLMLLLVLLPPVVFVFFRIKKKITRQKKDIQYHNQQSHRYLMDALKGYIESNIYNRHEFFLNRFTQSRKKFSQALFGSLALQTIPSRIIEIFAIFGFFALVVIANWSGVHDDLFIVTAAAFMAAAYKIIPGLVKIINLGGQMKAYEFSVDDKYKTAPPKLVNDTIPAVINSLQFKNISFQYNGHPVLQNFNLSIQPGDLIGITGMSGKGKTTIVNLLLGFLDAISGEITVNNKVVKNGELKKTWPSIAYVRQQSFLIHDTMSRNITLEEEPFDISRLQSAIKITGLSQIIEDSEGREKIIMENGKNISGGQQQRIALARALYKSADLILLDEPFNELDEAAETTLLDHCRMMTEQGKMIVLITHNKKNLAHCTKIISLDENQ